MFKINFNNIKIYRLGPDGRKLEDMPGRHNMDYTIKTHLKREPATTMLKVNKLKLSNAGTYTVRVTNGVQTKEEKFKLIIRSEPSAQITMTSPQGLYSLVSSTHSGCRYTYQYGCLCCSTVENIF